MHIIVSRKITTNRRTVAPQSPAGAASRSEMSLDPDHGLMTVFIDVLQGLQSRHAFGKFQRVVIEQGRAQLPGDPD
ncbi:MAG TPA: hypothetical protein VN798_09545, partial [Pseudomonas sp.]|nr:hypothetical protein [Pseudomonas sp.]